MRLTLFAILVLGLAAPLGAQQLDQKVVTARVQIPDFLQLEVGSVSQFVRADGKHVRRTTLLVTANRPWVLDVRRSCVKDCSSAEYTVNTKSGGPGRSQPVVVECVWEAREEAPLPTEFEYSLSTE